MAVKSFKEFLFKKKTNGVPFTMICPLNIPIFEPLPQADQDAIKKLKTYYPNTVINTGAWTEIEYIADTKEFLLSQNKNLQKQILDIQNALISQKISGGGIKVTNSAKLPIVKLSVFGKSEQITTTGANLFNALTITEKHWLNTENGNIEPASTFWTSDFIEVEEGDYCLTEKGTNRNCGYDEGKNFVKALLASKGKITVTSDIKFIRVSGVYETIKPNNFMISRGSTTKPYEPYTGGKPSPSPEYPQEITSCGENSTIDLKIAGDNAEPQTLTIPTPNGLLGLKVDVNGNYTDENGQQWIADEIDLARGKYVQRIAKKIIDGSEELADNIGSKTSYFLKVNDARSNTGMCNYGKRIPITGQKQEELTVSIDDNGIYLYTIKAVNEFKKLLKQKYDSGKPVEVLYALKNPVETDLPAEIIAAFKQLHTNHPTTIISNNADAGMELTYTVDTQSYIDSKIAEINMQVVNTQKQLLQERSK